MGLIARIDELLVQRGWTKYQLAKEANLSQSTISSMINRGNNPTISTIESCCKAFSITLAEFFDADLRDKEFSLEERKFIRDWRQLSPEMKDAVQQMIAAALQEKNQQINRIQVAVLICIGRVEQRAFGLPGWWPRFSALFIFIYWEEARL